MLRTFASHSLVTIVLVLLACAPAAAYRLALLPVHDLTASRSGLDIALTKQLSDVFTEHNIDMAPYPAIIDFLVENSIRRSGEIDSLAARRMSRQLSIDGILLTTLTEHTLKPQPKLALTLVLLDAKSGEQIWGTTITDHINDSHPLLGIGQMETVEQLQHHMLQEIATRIATTIPQLPQRDAALPDYRITDIELKPALVRNGNPVFCRIQIKFIDQTPDYLEVATSAGSTILRKSRIPNSYEGFVATNPRDGKHPVNLKIHWSRERFDMVDNLIRYQVASTPPALKMHVSTGLNIEETYAFSDSIVILPRLEEKRPLDRWELKIKDDNGETILTEGKYASLPERLEWRGTDAYNHRLETGRYTMVMQVWDIAGNRTQVATKFYLQPANQDMINISQVSIDGKNYLKLSPAEDQLVPVEQWSLELETPEGNSVFNKTGWDLPSLVEIPLNLETDQLICSVQSLDRLGNNAEIKTAQLNLSSDRERVAQQHTPDTLWSTDF